MSIHDLFLFLFCVYILYLGYIVVPHMMQFVDENYVTVGILTPINISHTNKISNQKLSYVWSFIHIFFNRDDKIRVNVKEINRHGVFPDLISDDIFPIEVITDNNIANYSIFLSESFCNNHMIIGYKFNYNKIIPEMNIYCDKVSFREDKSPTIAYFKLPEGQLKLKYFK